MIPFITKLVVFFNGGATWPKIGHFPDQNGLTWPKITQNGLCCKKIGPLDMPWRSENKWPPTSSNFKIFLGLFYN
jgi:hypothetical protein